MQIFIRSYDRPETISTHLALDGLDYRIVVHSTEQFDAYAKNKTIDESRLIVSGAPTGQYGICHQTKFVMGLVEVGEWFILIDDDIGEMTIVDPAYYNNLYNDTQDGKNDFWKPLYHTPCSPQRFLEVVQECIDRAESCGAHLCGFSPTPNHYFRSKKWRYAGYVPGAITVRKRNPRLRVDTTIGMEDFRDSAEHLRIFGSVVVNNYLWHGAKMYIDGGMGPYNSERLETRKKDVAELMKRYDGLLRVRERTDFEYGTDLAFRLHSPDQIAKWRLELAKRRLEKRGIGRRRVGRV